MVWRVVLRRGDAERIRITSKITITPPLEKVQRGKDICCQAGRERKMGRHDPERKKTIWNVLALGQVEKKNITDVPVLSNGQVQRTWALSPSRLCFGICSVKFLFRGSESSPYPW